MVEEELFLESTSLEEISEELPDNQPRFVLISYRYQSTDGRLSFPMVFIYWSPVCVKPELHMLYAGAKTHIVNVCDCVGKVYDVREEEQLNDEWMREKLAFFR